MSERPILFSAPMVRAVLDGSKTQTRRIMRVQPPRDGYQLATCISTTGPNKDIGRHRWVKMDGLNIADGGEYFACPYGQPGDRLWVRETWAPADENGLSGVLYRADFGDGPRPVRYKPSIHMPRWASRINLEITGVRVERLQDISEADAQAEGCSLECMTPTGDDDGSAIYGPGGYIALWESLNGAGSWNANPWVWVIEFKTGMNAA